MRKVCSKMFAGLLISNSIRVVGSTDKTLMGLCGQIVDETKNTLVVALKDARVVIPKSVVSFEMRDNSGKAHFNGSDLIGTPQERINKV